MNQGDKLWQFFKEVKQAVDKANQGDDSQPYQGGQHMITALTDDLELTIYDISEEDAILICSELSDMGVKTLMRASVICPGCHKRVPEQDYCTNCRQKLSK